MLLLPCECFTENHDNIFVVTFGTHFSSLHKAMINVPIPMNIHPIKDCTVNFSCNKRKANSIVITILNLSMGTTFDTSPICERLW